MAVYHIVLRGAQSGIPVQNGWYIGGATSALDSEVLDSICEALVDGWIEDVQPGVHPSLTWDSVSHRRVDIADEPTIPGLVTGLPASGTLTGTPMPRQVTLLQRWAANTPEPNRTWNHTGGWTTASWGGLGWDSAARDRVDAWGLEWKTAVEDLAPGYTVVVARWNSAGTLVTNFNPVNRMPAPAEPGSLRGRRTG